MGRIINIMYAFMCMVIYLYVIALMSDGQIGVSNDTLLIGTSLIIAGCLAYGGDD